MSSTKKFNRPGASRSRKGLMRRRRRALGLTLHSLANSIGVQLSAVGHWEAGRRRPCRAHCERLSAILELPARELAKDWGGYDTLARWQPRGVSQPPNSKAQPRKAALKP